MFEFFESRENKRAFKKALEEIAMEESSVSYGKHTSDTTITRVYKTDEEASAGRSVLFKNKNPLRRPETTAVDLKNFRNWRKVNKVASNHPQYPTDKKLFTDNEDDEDDFVISKPNTKFNEPIYNKSSTNSASTIDLINKMSETPNNSLEKDKNFDTYYTNATNTEKPKAPVKKQSQNYSLRELIEKFAPGHIEKYEKSKTTKKVETKPVENTEPKIKVEVVDLTEKENEQKKPVKKKTNRKPRGKNKRRFDADVISSVEWK